MPYKDIFLNNLLFFLLIIIYCIYGDVLKTIYFFSFIVIHECAHYLILRYYKIDIKKIELYPFGGKLTYNYKYVDRASEICIYAAGPAANILLGFVLYVMNVDTFYINANFFLALLNLIPVLPLDGGRILRSFLINHIPYEKATNILCKAAYLLSFVMVVCSINKSVLFKGNISLCIFAVFISIAAYKENKTSIYMFMRDIAYKKEILLKKRTMNLRIITALKNNSIKETYKKFLYGQYHIVYVMNEDLTKYTPITETQIFNAALKYGLNCTLDDVVKYYGGETNEK